MASLTQIKQRFWNNDGTVAAGGKVYVYLAGTVTPTNSYTDATGSTPNANPVILDSKGEAAIFTDRQVKINVLQSDNVQVTGYPMDYTGQVYANLAGSSGQNFAANTLTASANVIIDNGLADGSSLVLKSQGFTSWDFDNISGNLRFLNGTVPGGVGVIIRPTTGNTDFIGSVLSVGNLGIGHGVGSGGTIEQVTSKSTGVTLNKMSGVILMHNAALAAGAAVNFQLANNVVKSEDTIIANIVWDTIADPSKYSVRAASFKTANGTIMIVVKNETGGSLSEAVSIRFSIIKGSIT